MERHTNKVTEALVRTQVKHLAEQLRQRGSLWTRVKQICQAIILIRGGLTDNEMRQDDINRVVCKPRERGHGEPEIGLCVIREVELKTKILTPDVFIQEFWIDENTGNTRLGDNVWITISEIPSLVEALREVADIKD